MSLFNDRFRQLKDESNLTLKDLSIKLDITIPNLSYYMKGREPNYDVLIKIADCFKVTTDWLVGRTDARNPDALDTISIIENKLGVDEDEKLTGDPLERYLETQYIIFDILKDSYFLNCAVSDVFFKEFNPTFRMSVVTFMHYYNSFANIISKKQVAKDDILNFIQDIELISDLLRPLMLACSYNFAGYMSSYFELPKKEEESLDNILEFTFKKFKEKYPDEKIEEMFEKMNNLRERHMK